MIPTPLLRALCAGILAALCLAGCASKGPAKEGADTTAAPARNPLNPADPAHFIPAAAFDAQGNRVGTPATAALAPSPGLAANAFRPEVILYFSPASRSFYRRGDVDPAINRVLWERFLGKYEIPYRVVEDAAALQQAGTGVLVLPANMALGADERQAIVDFRARGGSLFASWLLGTHDKDGSWRGFDWMESLLGIGVVGTTAPHEEDRYINPYGDSPVIHALPAGTRIWTERAPGWWPLRITGRNDAAQVRTWSRATDAARPQVVAAFDEVATASGATSRMVYFGWPERLWMAADPGKHEGLLYDSLTWLLRQPSAWVANWPDARQSAYVTAVYMADVFNDNDLPFADRQAARGMLATYFILGFEIDKSADTLKALQKRGHGLAYEGDEYVGFKDVPIEEQSARMQKMREDVAASGADRARAGRLLSADGRRGRQHGDRCRAATLRLHADLGPGHRRLRALPVCRRRCRGPWPAAGAVPASPAAWRKCWTSSTKRKPPTSTSPNTMPHAAWAASTWCASPTRA